MKRITVLGPAHPFRGGLSSIMETIARTFASRGATVDIKTFTVQYPDFLFPGRSQYSGLPAPGDLTIERCVSTVNPFNWIKLGLRIKKEAPDAVIMRYWTPFMGPCFGTIARIARSNGHTRVLVQLDNVIPHERHATDMSFTRYFLHSVDGFIYMSDKVLHDLKKVMGRRLRPALFSPHPLFSNFGQTVSKEEACRRLDLDPQYNYSLFFGLIRDYKGLDILLDAWGTLKLQGKNDGHKLIIAGEFYTDKGQYLDQIAALGLLDDIIMHDYFVPDDKVRYFFSASDVLILPYHSATQSGVTQIAYHFELPMIVTNVGGLAETVHDGVAGYVCNPSSGSLADAIERFREEGTAERFRGNMKEEKKRFSWEATADKFEELYKLAAGKH